MWKRKTLKEKARKVVSKNYWTAVVVCFLMALFTGEFGTSIIGIWQTDDSVDPNYIIKNSLILENNDIAKEKLEENTKYIDISKIKDSLSETQQSVFGLIEANVNNIAKSQKYIFRIWDAINSFNIKETGLGIKLCIIALIAIAFGVFVAEPISVGGKRYFLKAREENKTKLNVIWEIFQKENLFNVSYIMLMKNIYNTLWYLTIIGGIIKKYEYKMIPYILAQNPKVSKKEAFALSKQMMNHNKWKTFLLEFSFILWNILSIFTLGMLKILYVNLYNIATMTELYSVLKENAIKEKIKYYEKLCN